MAPALAMEYHLPTAHLHLAPEVHLGPAAVSLARTAPRLLPTAHLQVAYTGQVVAFHLLMEHHHLMFQVVHLAALVEFLLLMVLLHQALMDLVVYHHHMAPHHQAPMDLAPSDPEAYHHHMVHRHQVALLAQVVVFLVLMAPPLPLTRMVPQFLHLHTVHHLQVEVLVTVVADLAVVLVAVVLVAVDLVQVVLHLATVCRPQAHHQVTVLHQKLPPVAMVLHPVPMALPAVVPLDTPQVAIALADLVASLLAVIHSLQVVHLVATVPANIRQVAATQAVDQEDILQEDREDILQVDLEDTPQEDQVDILQEDQEVILQEDQEVVIQVVYQPLLTRAMIQAADMYTKGFFLL